MHFHPFAFKFDTSLWKWIDCKFHLQRCFLLLSQIAEGENLDVDSKYRALVAIGTLVFFENMIYYIYTHICLVIWSNKRCQLGRHIVNQFPIFLFLLIASYHCHIDQVTSCVVRWVCIFGNGSEIMTKHIVTTRMNIKQYVGKTLVVGPLHEFLTFYLSKKKKVLMLIDTKTCILQSKICGNLI